MKRFLALVLCFCLVFCICGCNKSGKNGENSVDIEYYAKLGQIPENEIALGISPEKLIEILDKRGEEAEKNGEHYGYDKIEGENNVLIEEGPYDYYYKKANPENGIQCIVSYLDAFGFELGDVIVEVEEQLEDYDVENISANENNAFFYFGDYSRARILKATFDKNIIIFLFEDSSLCATAIYSKEF